MAAQGAIARHPRWQVVQGVQQSKEDAPLHAAQGLRLHRQADRQQRGRLAAAHRLDSCVVGFVFFVHFACGLPSPRTHLEKPP